MPQPYREVSSIFYRVKGRTNSRWTWNLMQFEDWEKERKVMRRNYSSPCWDIRWMDSLRMRMVKREEEEKKVEWPEMLHYRGSFISLMLFVFTVYGSINHHTLPIWLRFILGPDGLNQCLLVKHRPFRLSISGRGESFHGPSGGDKFHEKGFSSGSSIKRKSSWKLMAFNGRVKSCLHPSPVGMLDMFMSFFYGLCNFRPLCCDPLNRRIISSRRPFSACYAELFHATTWWNDAEYNWGTATHALHNCAFS